MRLNYLMKSLSIVLENGIYTVRLVRQDDEVVEHYFKTFSEAKEYLAGY